MPLRKISGVRPSKAITVPSPPITASSRIPLAIFGLLFAAYACVHQGWGWNQNSRLDLLHAIVIQHTLQIDAYQDNTGDKAMINGHAYSEKAPAITLIALPSFVVTASVLKVVGIDIDSPLGWTISAWAATAGSVGLLAALGGTCVFLMLRRRIGDMYAFVTVLAAFLGSLPFPYATMMFSHAGTAGLLAIALWAYDASAKGDKRVTRLLEYLMGFAMGLAVASEYPAAIAAGAFFLLLWLRGWQSVLRFVLGSILPLLLIPVYNVLVSGSPFTLGYGSVDFAEMKEGFFGATTPRPSAIVSILISEFRGLFFWSPFLLLAVPGWVKLWKSSRPLFFLTTLVPAAYVLFVSSYAYWDGGYAFGPRHLTLIVPLLAVAAGFGCATVPSLGIALAALSIVLTGFATFVNAMTPNDHHAPLTDFYPQQFAEGKIAMNLGMVAGLSTGWSAAVLAFLLAAAVAAIAVRIRLRRRSGV